MNTNRILIIASPDNKGLTAINQGCSLSNVLKKEATVIFFQYSNDNLIVNEFIEENKSILKDFYNNEVEILIKKGSLKSNLIEIATDYKPISIICGIKNNSKKEAVQLLKYLKDIHAPYYIIQEGTATSAYKKVFLPIGYKKEDKENAIWASYFKRFSNTEIVILELETDDISCKQTVAANMLFIKKMFSKLDIEYKIEYINTKYHNLYNEAISLASTIKDSIVIISTTKFYGPDDLIWGPKESKLIINKELVPIMCVNPRKDFYILCD